MKTEKQRLKHQIAILESQLAEAKELINEYQKQIRLVSEIGSRRKQENTKLKEALKDAFKAGVSFGREEEICNQRYNPMTGYEPKNSKPNFEEWEALTQEKGEKK